MRLLRVILVAVLPLFVLVLGVLLLQDGARAEPPGQVGTAGTAQWPPFHQNLSETGERDSGDVDVAADGDTIVVVWAEGTDARQLNNGVIRMAWKRGAGDDWHALDVPPAAEGYAHYQPAVALDANTAHVVWVRQVTEGADKDATEIHYAQCDLVAEECAVQEAVQSEPDPTYACLAPDVALGPGGVPHVVWVLTWVGAQDTPVGKVWYRNRVGGFWGAEDAGERVSGGVQDFGEVYTEDNPVIAADADHVYVAWDENYRSVANADGGIYFRQRDDATSSSGGTDWDPDGLPYGKQLSRADPTSPVSDPKVDGFPTLGVGGGWVYVMWERSVLSQTIPFFSTVYSYSLPYRVYTGTNPQDDWWPGQAAIGQAWWATMPFTPTSAADAGDYYGGVRPSLEMVTKTPHVVWHQWCVLGRCDPGQGTAVKQAQVGPAGDLGNEWSVNAQDPYKVFYATYSGVEDPSDLEAAETSWVSKTLKVYGSEYVLARPDLALAEYGGETYLHVAAHQRQGYVSGDASFAWDVWYTNEYAFFRNYLPILSHKYPD